MNAIRNAGCIFLFTLVLGAAFFLNAQQTPMAQPSKPPADRCAAPEYKQLDFILGSWEVTSKGKKSADVTFETTSNSSCGVMESWKNANGGGGNGLFANSPVGHGWQYFWVPSSGQPTWLHDGKPTGNGTEMQFTLTRTAADGTSHESKWTITKTPEGQIREVSVNTVDGKSEYELLWTKKP